MKLSRLIVLVTLLLLAAPSAALAQVPGYFPVQAFLTDSQGVPVDGSVELEFNIYDASTNGAVLYSETQTVQADAGALTAYLGETAELDLSIFSDNQELFLGVTIDGGEELRPLQRLATVPYAARAQSAATADSAATLDGRPASDFEPTNYTAAAPLEVDANDEIRIITTCAVDSVLKWSGSSWECTPDAQLTASGPVEINNNQIGLVTCPSGQILKSNGTTMACADDIDTDTDTQYGAATGLSLSGGQFSVDYSTTQARVSGVCDGTGGNDYIAQVLADGTVVCGTDSDSGGDITAVSAGDGLAGGTSSGAATLRVGAGGVNSSMIQSGAVTSSELAADAVTSAKIADGTITNTDVSASAGIESSKINFGSAGTSVSASFGTFRPMLMCPVGNIDGPPCNGAAVGTFCEGDASEFDNGLDNCGIWDWYMRMN
jgi:hypothetical protein